MAWRGVAWQRLAWRGVAWRGFGVAWLWRLALSCLKRFAVTFQDTSKSFVTLMAPLIINGVQPWIMLCPLARLHFQSLSSCGGPLRHYERRDLLTYLLSNICQ
jgi:hypothetical protein